ncbi:MAG: NmrA family NAD(P)-binding protein [Cyanothece sp. SIO1E1]|nr:NmrA family NAD(P)-binding protein [Cyanothece sp. SIO1E1]
MKIALFNATGAQGTAIASLLQKKNYELISPVRSKKNLTLLTSRKIKASLSDFSPESLGPILAEVDQVVLQIPAQISPSLMISMANNALTAIQRVGSPRTIFVISSTVPEQPTGKASPDARWQMKQKAMAILPDAILLSATEYLENFSTSYRQAIKQEGIIPQTIPNHLPVNYLSWHDLALYVEAALQKTDLPAGFYAIGGAEGITGEDLAFRLGKVLKKKLHYQTLSHQQLEGFLTPIVGLPLAAELAEFYEWQDGEGSHLLNPDTSAIRKRLGITLPDFELWAKRAFSVSEA